MRRIAALTTTGLNKSPDYRAAWAEEIRHRLEQIRSGTSGPDLLEVVAALDRYESEFSDFPLDEEDDESADPAEIEAARDDEITERLRELSEGPPRRTQRRTSLLPRGLGLDESTSIRLMHAEGG